MKNAGGVFLYLLLLLTPIALVAVSGPKTSLFGRMAGVAALTIFSLQFVLAAKLPLVARTFGTPLLLALHQRMAIFSALLVICHIAMIVLATGNWELVTLPAVGWPIQVGRLGLLFLTITLIVALARKRLPINSTDWRWLHGSLAWAILLLCFVHGLVLGSSSASATYCIVTVVYFSTAVLSWIWAKRAKTR